MSIQGKFSRRKERETGVGYNDHMRPLVFPNLVLVRRATVIRLIPLSCYLSKLFQEESAFIFSEITVLTRGKGKRRKQERIRKNNSVARGNYEEENELGMGK